jgi:ketol-acid reductoisomerase
MTQQFPAEEWHFASEYRTDLPGEGGTLEGRLHGMINLRFLTIS